MPPTQKKIFNGVGDVPCQAQIDPSFRALNHVYEKSDVHERNPLALRHFTEVHFIVIDHCMGIPLMRCSHAIVVEIARNDGTYLM